MLLSEILLCEKPIVMYRLRSTPQDKEIKQDKEQVNIDYTKERRAKDSNGKFREFSFKTGKQDYNTRIRIYGKQNSKSPCWVHCTCPNFRYTWNWVLTNKDSSNLYQTLDKSPEIRNPERKIGICKHLKAAFEWLKNERGF